MKYYATFLNGQSMLKNMYVVIEAPCYEAAHNLMQENFATRWGSLYGWEEFKHQTEEFSLVCMMSITIDEDLNVTKRGNPLLMGFDL